MDTAVLSVSDFIALTNQTLEYAYPIVVIEGEVGSFKVSRDKYVFFDIKDHQGSVGCFMMLFSLKVAIEDGMKIQITARPKLTDWGKFSLTVQDIKLVGDGALQKSFEILKAKLVKEGLFAQERKRSLPEFPSRVGIISSVGAAGYEDFIKIIDTRWGGVSVDVADVRVQGDRSADQIVSALEHFNQSKKVYDVVVLVRGGGSLDDLQAFNTETVARAVGSCRYPVLVGVGHEQDITLAGLAADVRASTPSNAAEILVPSKEEYINEVTYRAGGIQPQVVSIISRLRDAMETDLRRSVDIWTSLLQHYKLAVENASLRLASVNPDTVLARGYSMVFDESGKLVKSSKSVQPNDELVIKLHDGNVKAKVTK